MAPMTRLHANPTRRVVYSSNAPSENASASPARAAPSPKTARTKQPPKQNSHRVTKSRAKKQPALPETKECIICAEQVSVDGGYKTVHDMCRHFKDICIGCTSIMVEFKLQEGRVNGSTLRCPWDCDYALSFQTLREILPEALFNKWDEGITKSVLRTDSSFTPCLNVNCGLHFSTENCNVTEQNIKAPCPYCQLNHCLSCSRPWHGDAACDRNKSIDDVQMEMQLKAMGAKACPSCGINIEKSMGCDHMLCQNCGTHFCWDCLVKYAPGLKHAAGCRSGLGNMGNDPATSDDDSDGDNEEVSEANSEHDSLEGEDWWIDVHDVLTHPAYGFRD